MEEISVYIDVDAWMRSHMDGGEAEDEVDMVLQSVEIKADFKVDINMNMDVAMLHGIPEDERPYGDGNRESLASIDRKSVV